MLIYFQSETYLPLPVVPPGPLSTLGVLSRAFMPSPVQSTNQFTIEDGSRDVEVNVGEIERRLDELAAIGINGRQIRNALLTARQLAIHRQDTLDWDNLKRVLDICKRFNHYLKTVQGARDEDWARSESWR